jgi:WhiB family transcriptional regulator, redox-sensing transcriptional regulator
VTQISRLPATAASVWNWQYEGACREADPTLFFHPEGERGPARRQRDAQAVAVCAQCPVIERCRQHGFSVREPYGIWGGLTQQDREQMQRLDTV